MIYVADAIMGTGKSSAAITYMNEHPEKKFIYITPYLSEVARIKNACAESDFIEPEATREHQYTKKSHTEYLIDIGRNIVTTHQSFKVYDDSMLERIREQHYTLIVDEAVDVLETINESAGDLQVLIDGGYLEEARTCVYRLSGKKYGGTHYKQLMSVLKNHEMIRVNAGDGNDVFFYWLMPPSLISSFDDVFILTYMFNGQDMHHFLEMNHMGYTYINIAREDGVFRFTDKDGYVPDYVRTIKDKIHICQNEKLNEIGDDKYAMSVTWFDKHKDKVLKLKNNTLNFFKNMNRCENDEKMWSTFGSAKSDLKGQGYTKAYTNFNLRATNDLRKCKVLVYDVNIFMHVGQKIFFMSNGINVDDDAYALSIMVQWIWRSAIRDGIEIYIYIPSRRMRELLTSWLDSLSKEVPV